MEERINLLIKKKIFLHPGFLDEVNKLIAKYDDMIYGFGGKLR